MCTVTYINNKGTRYFTSNRDENRLRPPALMPQTNLRNSVQLIYPADAHAGGSWFAITEKRTVAVLLNGAFEKHIPVYPYRISRGIVLLDIASGEKSGLNFQKMNLEKVEPFTIILFEEHNLNQLVWDGNKKHTIPLDSTCNYIWSSVTLYDNNTREKRNKHFDEFMDSSIEKNTGSIIDFHSHYDRDAENGFFIKRENGIHTQSITQAVLLQSHIEFSHYDMLTTQRHTTTVSTQKNIPVEQV